MNPLRLVNYLWPAFISMIILSAIVASLPEVLANQPSVTNVETVEPLEASTGEWQDLQGLEVKDREQWSWDIEESDGIISENIEYNVSPNLLNESDLVDVEQEDEDWENSHRGDPKSSGGLVPLAEF
ncbi:hypothetical protein [Crocosphaera chwakensis]|uniref:Uncharacterized protein n=1 Tax=Crocosphaera chwakensis CCY0110 TaxID=391612 RepID=A3IQW9_9CHRO|nr:hypothetical protein [Crocosphaera chwakensis]EAZ91174.1 hypothetical protein CY0110_12942 [Crocosphaera chwakensis CCY0110]